jgi:alkylation response protein AidB-like acyl-CoA dehydrogenase
MFLLARTDPDAPKHKGISFLLLDMKTPGVEVRPLVNIIGGHAFNEVFFDNARVPKANLVGQKNDGWTVATTLLNFERSGIDRVASARRLLDEVIEFVREGKKSGRLTQPVEVVRQKLAEMVIELEVGRWMGYHVSWMQQKGQMPWAEAPISKVFGSELMQRVANVGMQLLSLYGQLEKGSKWISLGGRVAHMYQSSLGRTLGGGTSEIQRNLIATRGLGLPRG